MKTLLYLLCTAALLSACSKEAPGGAPQGPQEIKFRTYIEEGGAIRPMSALASRTIAGDLANGYHLSTLLTTSNYPVTSHDKLMWNVEMNRDGSYKSASEKRYFWAEGNAALRHTFVAYSANPSGTTAGEGVNPTTLAVGGDGRLTASYSNPDDPAKQIDFLYSENVSNVKVSTSVPVVGLVFKHRMARVMVKLIGTGGATLTKCQAQIAYKSSAVRRTATLTLSDNNAATLNTTYHSGAYNLGTEFSLPGSANTPVTAVEMGDMILIPQSLADEWATLTLTYTLDGASASQSVSVALPALPLIAGKQHEILVNVIVETKTLSVSNVTLTDWSPKTGTIDKL